MNTEFERKIKYFVDNITKENATPQHIRINTRYIIKYLIEYNPENTIDICRFKLNIRRIAKKYLPEVRIYNDILNVSRLYELLKQAEVYKKYKSISH